MGFVTRREWAFIAAVVIYSAVPTFGGLFRVAELLGAEATLPENPRATALPLPIALHIVVSFVYCLLGALQFVPSVRRKHINLHRAAGRIVVVSGCVSALTGLWMTHYFTFPKELQGAALYWTRIVLSLSMIGLIVRAVLAARSRNIRRHSADMVRAYAIGQGASTQAFLGIGWLLVAGVEATGMSRDVIMIGAWGVNLLVAELLITRRLHVRSLRAAQRAPEPRLPVRSAGRGVP